MTPVDVANPTRADVAMRRKLTLIWEDLLGIAPIEPDQNYFDLGGDSSLAVRMFAEIDKVFGVKLPLVTLYEASTINELAGLLAEGATHSDWSSLVAIQPRGSRPPLFCFHGAGGNVLNYQRLSHYLGDDQPLYGLQSKGLDGRSAPITTIQEMAELYVEHIREVQPHGPYFLAGYCMGGTIAYETAQQLRSGGEQVALLALLDTMNWHLIPLTFRNKASHASQRVLFHIASFLTLNRPDKRRYFRAKVDVLRNRVPVWRGVLRAAVDRRRSATGFSDPVLLGRVWKTNDRACWRYVPQPYAGAVADFRPFRQYRIFRKDGLKWEKLAQGGVDVRVLPVYPAGMLVEPFVKPLADALRQSLDQASQSHHAGELA